MYSVNRRHYLALCGSVALAGCSADPTGIISGDGGFSPSPIETTIEGTGQSLRDIRIENNGLTMFSIDTSERIDVYLIGSEAESSIRLGVDEPSEFTKIPIDTLSEEYAIEITTESNVSWKITVEDHPIYSQEEVGMSEFPIEFSGTSDNVFGPFFLDGFYQPRLRTNESLDFRFISQDGDTLHSFYPGLARSFINLDPINVSEVCWVSCDVAHSDDIDPLYEIKIVEPDNG